MLLSDYLTEVRTHLEEFPFSGVITTTPLTFWSDQQLTSAINKARDRVAIECWCCRSLQFIQAVQAQSVYNFSVILAAAQALPNPPPIRAVVHLHTVNFQWATSFQPQLRRVPWNEFNARYRAYPTLQSQSAVYGLYDMQNFYVWPPPPSNAYQMETDVTYLPTMLTQPSQEETAIPEQLGWPCVTLLACYWSLFYRRAYDEAKEFLGLYMEQRDVVMGNSPAWVIESPYGDD